MKAKVRVGVIGTSWWADWLHLPALKADSRVDLAAICGRGREHAQEMATKYGIGAVYTNYREMIGGAKLDAVVVATPDDEHYAMTMAALDAGLHVLCEKPLAMNAAHAKAMYDQAEAKGLRHLTYFTHRWGPGVRYARELVEQGAVGRLYHCDLRYVGGHGRSPSYAWRFDRKRANGILGDLGSHMIDMTRLLAGEISRVSASLAAHVVHQGPDGRAVDPANDSAMLLIELAGGAHGTIHVSAVARTEDPAGQDQIIALHGNAGSLVVSMGMERGNALRVAKGDGALEPVTIPERYFADIDRSRTNLEQFVQAFTCHPVGARLFVDSILAGKTATPSFHDGWKAQQVMDAAIASHEARRWVDVG